MRVSKATPLAHVQSVFHGHLTTFHFGGGRLAIKDLPKLEEEKKLLEGRVLASKSLQIRSSIAPPKDTLTICHDL